jgi:hypothetical protein
MIIQVESDRNIERYARGFDYSGKIFHR